MNGSINTISLDLHRSEAPRAIFVKKGDTVRGISAALVEDGKEYKTTSDCSAVLSAILPDGSAARTNMEIYQHRLHAKIPAEWTENAGVIRCEVRLFGASPAIRLTSPTFSIIVTEALSILGPENFAYWYKGTYPTTSSTRRIPITDANFEFDFPEADNAYNGWVLIPKSLYPDDGVYICSTGGIVFPYDSEKSISVGSGEYVTFKCFKSPTTFSAHQYVVVREREES